MDESIDQTRRYLSEYGTRSDVRIPCKTWFRRAEVRVTRGPWCSLRMGKLSIGDESMIATPPWEGGSDPGVERRPGSGARRTTRVGHQCPGRRLHYPECSDTSLGWRFQGRRGRISRSKSGALQRFVVGIDAVGGAHEEAVSQARRPSLELMKQR